jgi:hypothetical protein
MSKYFTMRMPPGISLFVTAIFRGSLPLLTLGTLDHLFLRPRKVHNLPPWVTVMTCLLAPLATFSMRLLLGDLINYVKAKRAGAVLPPHNPTWVPGAINRVIGTLKAEDTIYLGNILANSNTGYTYRPFKATPLRI